MKLLLASAIGVSLAAAASAHPASHSSAPPAQTVAAPAQAAAAVVDAFHAALRRGDVKAAESYLAENALIFESGGVERGKAEYAAHHLGADAEFSKAVPSTVTRRAGDSVGNLAWVATEGRTNGSFKGKSLNLVTTESMVLRRTGSKWKIVHIHWSSASGS